MATKNNFSATDAQDELHRRYNLDFADMFRDAGAKVYLFGGALRDMVMGKEWKDADIRVWIDLPPKERDARAEEILKKAGVILNNKTSFGEAFTVYRFVPPGSADTTEIDMSVVSGQWTVGPDFTINGLYFDVYTGELIDRYDSISHIKKRILRTAKNPLVQFKEEPYAIYRAVKSACQFGLEIEKETLSAMKELAPTTKGVLELVADRKMPAFTEWFLGNMWRGLKYDPHRFQEIWNETGLSRAFLEFTGNIVGTKPSASTIDAFKTEKTYGYEEALNIFLSAAARILDANGPQQMFNRIIALYSIKAPRNYADFPLDLPKIDYIA